MNFASDNWAGVSPQVLSALANANVGTARAYGGDKVTARLEEAFADLFERDVAIFPVVTGTAANALSLAALTPPWGAVLCHAEAHVMADECGATEFFSGGAKLIGFDGPGAKIPFAAVQRFLAEPRRVPHEVRPAALSLTQATELGTVYTADEIAGLAELAHAHGLAVHMDGARFANALARLGLTPAEMSWKAGVDVLSFGATKNGCLAAEVIVVFEPKYAASLSERRMRAGHLLSKSRFLAAQLEAYLADGHWLALASRANAAADRLAAGLRAHRCRLAFPVEANEIFAILPETVEAALGQAGAVFHRWPTRSLPAGTEIGPREVLVRLVTSFATTETEIDQFLAVLSKAEGAV